MERIYYLHFIIRLEQVYSECVYVCTILVLRVTGPTLPIISQSPVDQLSRITAPQFHGLVFYLTIIIGKADCLCMSIILHAVSQKKNSGKRFVLRHNNREKFSILKELDTHISGDCAGWSEPAYV